MLVTAADRVRVAEAARGSDLVAVDTEFHAERRYLPRLHLVQLRTSCGTTWLVDPHDDTTLVELADALRGVPWLLHGGAQDMRVLGAALGGLPDEVLDTQIAAGLTHEVYPAPYAALVREHLDVDLAKGATLTDWSQRPLTPAQLRYAAEDVSLLRPLWERLWARAGELGRQDLVRAACAEARRDALEPDPIDAAWRQVLGASALTPPQAAVLQALAAWREEAARAEDQPARSVIADPLLTDLARRQPDSIGAMAENRRLPKGILKRYGDVLLACVRRGRARPPESWPVPVGEGSLADRVAGWLHVLSQADGHARGYGARLAIPPAMREDLGGAFAAGRLPDRAAMSGMLGPWRDALVGDLVHRALTGGAALTIGPTGPRVSAP